MEQTEETQDPFAEQSRNMTQPPPVPPPSPSARAAAAFDAETIRAIRDRQDAIAAERHINEVAGQVNAIDFTSRAMELVYGDRTVMGGTVVGGVSGGITSISDRTWPDATSRDSFSLRHFESRILKLEEKLSGAKTAIEMLIEEYGKLSKKLDEREEEHSMLISELYKLKKAGEK